MKVTVLGAGRVGRAIAMDLLADGVFDLRMVDSDAAALDSMGGSDGIETVRSDLLAPGAVGRAVAGSDLVVSAVPGFMGYGTVEQVIREGIDVVDISFFPEDATELGPLAEEKGVRCLVDFGIAPGCSNLIFGHVSASFSRVDRFECYVGGLPVERVLPWEYQAPFSPSDVLEEYTRPARFVTGGRVVTKPALSDPELMDFPGVGTLEAFLTDGLRTLLKAPGVPEMVEKTLRYPGYRDRVLLLRESGFLDAGGVEVDGTTVSPLGLTSRLLFSAWLQRPGDEDFTAMRVRASGRDASGNTVTRRWDMLDRYDRSTGTTSMARTTGYTCTAGVRLLARDLWREAGVAPPEVPGAVEECFGFVMKDLESRGVVFEVADESEVEDD